MKWGMDIVGKLPQAPQQKVFMLAMTDYFSKWIEADSFRQVTEKEVISFIRKKYNMQVWYTLRNSVRQWNTVCRHQDCKFLQSMGYKIGYLNTKIPPSKWTG